MVEAWSTGRAFFENHETDPHREKDSEIWKQLRGRYVNPDAFAFLRDALISYCKVWPTVRVSTVQGKATLNADNAPDLVLVNSPDLQGNKQKESCIVHPHLQFRHLMSREGLIMPSLLRCAIYHKDSYIARMCPQRRELNMSKRLSQSNPSSESQGVSVALGILYNSFQRGWQAKLIFTAQDRIFLKGELLCLLANSAHKISLGSLNKIIEDVCLSRTRRLQYTDR